MIENVWLPAYNYCRISFLQNIVEDDKKVLTADQIMQRNFNYNYPEFAVKNVWPLVKHHEEFVEYLPDKEMDLGRYPDRKWFWGLALTLVPKWARSFVLTVHKVRKEHKRKLPAARLISMSHLWIKRLSQHDYQSKGKQNLFE